MDFGSVLYAAQKNERSTNKEVKYYKTTFAPPKKEVREPKQLLSANVKRFLEKREEEEKKKAREAKRKREELEALRSQDKKATKRVQVMLKRTKSANKSVIADAVDNVNTAVTMAGPVQPDEDDYGYVSQEASAFYNKLMDKYSHMPPEEPKFPQAKKATVKDLNAAKDRVRAALQREEEEEMMPHKRKRKKKSDENEKDADEREEEHEEIEEVEEIEEPKLKKIKRPAPPLPSFDQLLQIASKKQFEPIKIETKVKDDEPERPMTKKQKLEYEREKQWKMNRSEREAMREQREESLKEKRKLQSENSALNRIPKVSDSQDVRANRIPKLPESNRIPKVSDSQNNRISKPSDTDNRISKLSESRNGESRDKRPELQNNRISKLTESHSNRVPKLSENKNNPKISDNYYNRIPKITENSRQSDSVVKHDKRDDTNRCKSFFDSKGKSSKTNSDANDRKSSSSNERYSSNISSERTSKSEYRPSKISSDADGRRLSSSSVYGNEKYSSGDWKSSKTTLSAKDKKALFKSPSPSSSSSSSPPPPSSSVEERLKKPADVWSKPCNLTPPPRLLSHDSKKLGSRANGIDRRKESEALFQSRGPESKSKDGPKTDVKYKTDIRATENFKKLHPKIESSSSQKLPVKSEKSEFKKPSPVVVKERSNTGMSSVDRPLQHSGKPNLLKSAQAAAREAALRKAALSKEREVINVKKPQSDTRSKEFPPKDLKPKQFPPKDMKPKEFPPKDVKPKEFPPRDLKPKQFPPPDMRRRPKAPIKRRIDDDDEEYDSEMDDFIDDEPVEDEDYSKHIAEIFGYDKNKYSFVDDDDECMESSFGQLEKEEKFSLIQGVMEDLEDIRKEKREKERAKLKKLQKMQAARR